MNEIYYSSKQIEYWEKSYKQKMKLLEEKILESNNREFILITRDIGRLFHQIKIHLVCMAEFLHRIEEKQS